MTCPTGENVGELIIATEFSETETGCVSRIRLQGGGKDLPSIFYDFRGPILPRRPLTDDFAVLAVLPYAMCHGLAIRCEGRVSREQLERLEEAQDAWLLWHPDRFQRVSLRAAEEVELPKPADRHAVIAYSGGLDATFALHAHCRGLLGRREDRLRTAVMVHGLDVPLGQTEAFSSAAERGSQILKTYGIPLTTVRTNWRELRAPWEQSHIFAVSSVVHQFSGVVSRAVIAADEPYDREVLGWGSNSITNHLVGNAGFPIDFTGAGYSRTAKAKALGSEAAVLQNLRVCWQNPEHSRNCGTCEKCIRTKLNFYLTGASDVAALGPPPTVKELDRLVLKSEITISYFENLLQEGDWSGYEDLRIAVIRLLKPKGVSGFLKLTTASMMGRVRRFKRSLKKRRSELREVLMLQWRKLSVRRVTS
jgi:7-cyano-7-deazaguanine synthase in queuosine biosynthesis